MGLVAYLNLIRCFVPIFKPTDGAFPLFIDERVRAQDRDRIHEHCPGGAEENGHIDTSSANIRVRALYRFATLASILYKAWVGEGR
jgi:hypothetical protein